MIKYIHLNYILRFIREEEGKEFKIVNSEDYGIKGDKSFKVLIPKSFEVDKIILPENYFYEDSIEVLDKDGNNAIDGPYIFLWQEELYSTKKEKSVCVADTAIDEGQILFENFDKIPIIVSSLDILKYM